MFHCLSRRIGNSDARTLAWELLRERWNDAQKKTGEFVGTAAIVGALGRFCDPRALAQGEGVLRRALGH